MQFCEQVRKVMYLGPVEYSSSNCLTGGVPWTQRRLSHSYNTNRPRTLHSHSPFRGRRCGLGARNPGGGALRVALDVIGRVAGQLDCNLRITRLARLLQFHTTCMISRILQLGLGVHR